jgi:uncharacterized protein (TIGR04255 family)
MMGEELSIEGGALEGQGQTRQVPLSEVAYGVRFVAPEFDVVHFGEYHELIKAAFPKHQMVPPVPTQRVDQQIQTIQVPTLPRVWFESGTRLIQLQSDRFLYNWRRIDGASENYPGFEVVFGEFRERYDEFFGFAKRAFRLPLHIEELSLTYINQIQGATSSQVPTFSFRSEPVHSDLPAPDVWISQLRFTLTEENAKLTVSARPAINLQTQEQITQLDVTVESIKPPPFDDLTSLYAWYEAAHRLVHRGFRSLVSRERRTQWGFVDDDRS